MPMKLSEKKIRKIKKLLRKGKTLKFVAMKVEVSLGTVRKYSKEM